MTYNIHPIFVHFPIAMLLVYSLIKIIPLKKWMPRVNWRDIERVLLVVGVLGAFAALLTGDTAEHLMRPNHQLVEMHSFFGTLSTYIYGALLLGEIAAVANTRFPIRMEKLKIKKITLFLERLLADPILSGILAFLGLIAITTTGMLGGIIAYGTSADPMAPYLLKVLGITL